MEKIFRLYYVQNLYPHKVGGWQSGTTKFFVLPYWWPFFHWIFVVPYDPKNNFQICCHVHFFQIL